MCVCGLGVSVCVVFLGVGKWVRVYKCVFMWYDVCGEGTRVSG